jgi:hypothetical protein
MTEERVLNLSEKILEGKSLKELFKLNEVRLKLKS